MPYEVFTLKHNPEKTDPQYFKILFEKYGLTANDVVYFEHNAEAANTAQSVGILHISMIIQKKIWTPKGILRLKSLMKVIKETI